MEKKMKPKQLLLKVWLHFGLYPIVGSSPDGV